MVEWLTCQGLDWVSVLYCSLLWATSSASQLFSELLLLWATSLTLSYLLFGVCLLRATLPRLLSPSSVRYRFSEAHILSNSSLSYIFRQELHLFWATSSLSYCTSLSHFFPEPSELLLFQANFEHLWATLSKATLKVSYSEPLGAALLPCLATTSCIPARCAIPIKTIHGSVPIVLPTPAQSHIRVARARKQIPAFSQHKSLVLNCGASLGPSRFFENCALATVLCPHLPKVVRPNYQMVDDVMWFVHYCKIL